MVIAEVRKGSQEIAATQAEAVEALVRLIVPEDLRAAVLARSVLVERWSYLPSKATRDAALARALALGRGTAVVGALPPICEAQVGWWICFDALRALRARIMRDAGGYTSTWAVWFNSHEKEKPPDTLNSFVPLRGLPPAMALNDAIGSFVPLRGVPPEVALNDAIAWASEPISKLDPRGKAAVTESLQPRAFEFWPEFTLKDGELDHELFPYTLGLLYLAWREVDHDKRKAQIHWDTTDEHRQLVQRVTGMERGKKADLELKRGTLYLALPTAAGQAQLVLPGFGSLHQSVVESLTKQIGKFRKGEGLRHWIAFQLLLSTAGGRKGWVRWTVEDHLDALGISPASRTPAMRAQIAEAVWLFTQISIVFEEGGTRHSKSLVFVGDKEEKFDGEAWQLNGLELHVNPLLYEGVRDSETNRLGSNFYPLPLELARLNPKNDLHAMILGVKLSYPLRWDKKGKVRWTGRTLLEQAGVTEREIEGHPARAWENVEAALDTLGSIREIESWAWDAGAARTLDGCVTIYAAALANDRLLHGVRPVETLPKPVPLTGAELREWRDTKDLTQAEAAKLIGVGSATLKRAELQPKEALGRRLREALARYQNPGG